VSAIAEARAVIAAKSRSFALASRLLPREVEARAVVLYAWCRRVDDAVDHAPPGASVAAVARLEAELDAIYRGAPGDDLIVRAFAELAHGCRIPRRYPAELVAGMAMDAAGARYQSLDDLRLYCFRVAGTVGLMMSHVLGVSDERALEQAAHLGIAMQLTNICRDVAEDWAMGRLYLPDDVLSRHGAGDLRDRLGGPLPRAAAPALAGAIRELLALADRYYASGDRGLIALGVREALAVRAARNVYSAIGRRIEAAGCDPFAGRAVVPTAEKLVLVARASRAAAAELAVRARHRRRPALPGRELRFPGDIAAL
jgi:15-cis-phytoene synthase